MGHKRKVGNTIAAAINFKPADASVGNRIATAISLEPVDAYKPGYGNSTKKISVENKENLVFTQTVTSTQTISSKDSELDIAKPADDSSNCKQNKITNATTSMAAADNGKNIFHFHGVNSLTFHIN